MDAVRAALLSFRSKSGHFVGVCAHRMWINGHDNQPGRGHRVGVECPTDQQCDGTGSPCSARCLAANRALGLVEGAQAEMGL